MALRFEITGDNKNLLSSLDGAREGVRHTAQDIRQSGLGIEEMFKRIGTAAGIAFSAAQAKNFVSKVMDVRGQFQQLEIAFATMLNSEEKANDLMSQLVETAAKTPFDLQGVADGAKQLLAYGISANEVNETLTRLGDIAAGLSIPLGDLVYLYGSTMVQGRMFTMDLRQFMGRGIPMADELAKIFGVAKDEVAGLVTAGKVGAEEVKRAIWNMTEEGSKFGGLMAKQSQSITGQISNIEDSFDTMLNNIGKQSEGLINTGLSGVSFLIENYETVGKILLQLIATYGAYKVAVMTNIALEKVQAFNRLAHVKGITTMQLATDILTKKTAALNAVLKKNPFVLLGTLVMSAISAYALFGRSTDEVAEATKNLNASFQDTQAQIKSEQANIDSLFDKLRNAKEGTNEYKTVKDQILNQYGKYLSGLNAEIATLKDVEGAYKAVTKAAREASIARGKEAALKNVQETYGVKYSDYVSKLQTALKSVADDKTVTEIMGRVNAELNDFGNITIQLEGRIRKLFEPKKGGGLFDANVYRPKVGQYLQALRNNEKYLKDYSVIVEQRFHIDEEEQKHDEEKKVRNKQAIEEEKKNLQAQLDNLSKEEAAGKKGIALKKKINKLNSELNVYNVSDKTAGRTRANSSFKNTERQPVNTLNDADRTAEEEANRRQRDFDLYLREKEEQAAQSQATRDAIEQARIARIENDGEREREAEKEQHLLNLRAIDEREKDMKKALYEYNKNVWENRNKNNKLKYSDTEAGKAGWEGLTLTKEQQDELEALREKENSEYSRLLKNREREELQSMRDYLKEYGSFEQQRLAITEEYEEKIAEATTQGEKLRLQKERDQKLGSLNYENIAAGIDWKALFSGVGSLSNEMMQPMMDKLMAYTKTDEYLNADSQTQQSVAEIIQEIRQYLGTDQSMTWQALGKATENFMAAVDKYNQAVEDEEAAVKRLDQAKLDLKAGKITQAAFDVFKADADKFGKATQDAKESMEGFGTVLNDTSEQINNYTSKLTAALNKAKGWTGVDGFSGVQSSIGQIDSFKGALDSALPSMGDGIGKSISTGLSSVIGSGLSSLGSGLTSILSSGLGQTIGFVAQIPRLILDLVSNVKQFVTGILDSFTELISLRWIDDLVVSICDAIANLINAIFDLPENLFKVLEGIVVNGIGGLLNNLVGRIGNILSFGALSSGGPAEWFSSSNAKEVAETINRLTEENKELEQAIEDLKDEMEKSRGISAIEISRRAADLQELTDENYKKMAQAQARYHGDHHSWNYYWGGYNQEQIDRLSKQIGRQWNGDIWDLSPEEMKMLRSNVDMWNQIKDTGKSYYGSAVQEKLNDYIDQAGKLQEITDALYENLTTTTKDNVFDDFLNSLYDLADGSEDVFDNIAEEWQKMVNKMVINNLVGDRFQKKLESWYEELAKLNEAKIDGEITDAEYRERLDLLKAQYEDYMKDAERDVETLRNEGIIKASEDSEYKQEASSKGFQAMGQDVGEELNGRFTALQIAGESVAAQVISIYSQMIVISQIQVSSNTYLSEIRNMMIDGNSYLEDIAKYSKKIYIDFATKLDDITTNTK